MEMFRYDDDTHYHDGAPTALNLPAQTRRFKAPAIIALSV